MHSQGIKKEERGNGGYSHWESGFQVSNGVESPLSVCMFPKMRQKGQRAENKLCLETPFIHLSYSWADVRFAGFSFCLLEP